MTVVENGRHIN